MRGCTNAMRMMALVIGAGIALASCTEYLDRRDTISLNGGNAVATNKVTQMVDPWPRVSASREIAFDGQRMQSAIERYHRNKVYQPQGIGTSSSYSQSGPSSDAGNAGSPAPVGPTITQQAPPTK